MSRPIGTVLVIFAVLCAAACEDDPDDLNYLKAGAGGSVTAAGKSGSPATAGKGGGGAGAGTAGTAGTAGKSGTSSDADAGE